MCSIGLAVGLHLGRGGAVEAAPAFTTPVNLPGIAMFLSDTSWAASTDADAVTTWPDLSGNGRDGGQATAARKPTVKKTAVTGFLRDTVRFDAGDGLATAAFALSGCTRLAHYAVHRHNASNLGIVVETAADATAITDGFFQYVNSGTSPVVRSAHTGNVGAASFDSFETVPVSASVFHLIGAIRDKGFSLKEAMPVVDNIVGHGTIVTDSNNTNGFLTAARVINVGARDAGGTISLGINGDISAFVLVDTTAWGIWRGYYHVKTENYLRSRFFGLADYNVNLVFDGDSRTYGTGLTAGLDIAAKVLSRIGTSVPRVSNLGVPSQTVVQMSSDAAVQIDDYYVRGIAPMKNVVVAFGGVNDAAISGDSAATIYANLVTYCQARRAAGFQVVICTEIPAKSAPAVSAGWDAKRQTINANILANWTTFADALADFSANAAFDADADADNTTYYQADKIHPTATGADTLAGIVYTALGTLGIT